MRLSNFWWNSPALVLGLALTLFQAHEAMAGEDKRVQAAIRSADRFYEELKYERALTTLQRARQRPLSTEDAARIWIYEGILLAELNRPDKADDAWRRAFSLRLEQEAPARMELSPKIESRMEEVRQEARSKQAARDAPLREPGPRAVAPAAGGRSQQGVPVAPGAAEPVPSVDNPRRRGEGMSPVEGLVEQPGVRTRARPGLLVPGIAAGVLIAAGGTTWGLAWRERSRLRSDDPSLATPDDVRRATSRGRTYQVVGLSLMGAGLVTLGTAVGLHVFQDPGKASLSVGVAPGGASASISGMWP